jgi:hypothetical protein
MEKICHPHNLLRPRSPDQPRFGVRVSMPPGDTFRRLLGDDWQKEHWFQTSGERDRALERIRLRHPYYRIGDNPSLVVEAIER